MFETEQSQIVESLKGENNAKSWIVIGPHGVGKEAFAKNLVKVLTHDFNEYNPNVQWISCGLTDTAKKEIQKAILAGEQPEDKEWAKKTEITVDDVREGCRFLSLKSNKIKVLIFNLADEMNENAQNALLKTLEEPYPNTLILLLCENIGHLLPTILSRCQKIHLLPDNAENFQKQLKTKYPDLSEQDYEDITNLSNRVMGMADEIVRLDGLMLYAHLKELLQPTKDIDGVDLVAFAEQVSKNKEIFNLSKYLLLQLLSDMAKKFSRQNMERASALSNLYQQIKTLFEQTESQNLDKKQILISMIYQISEVL